MPRDHDHGPRIARIEELTSEMNERLAQVIAEVLDVDEGSDLSEAVRNEHPAWDSLAHLTLVTAIEEEFGVRFTMDEIESIETAQDFSEALRARS